MPCGARCGRRRSTYLRQAGAKALARSANREAVAHFEQALTALRHLPETRETLEQAIDLRFDLRNALLPLGEFERIFELSPRSRRPGRGRSTINGDSGSCPSMCHNLWATGHPSGSARVRQSAQAIAESTWGCSAPGDGKLYLGVSLPRDGGLSTGRGSSGESCSCSKAIRAGNALGTPDSAAVIAPRST